MIFPKNRKQKNKNFLVSRLLPPNSRGISIIIGYVLLVTFAMIIGGVIYQWLKTYVPTDILECPDGVSIFIEKASCTNIADKSELDLTIKNNGRFDIAGYFIHATNDSSQELATIDLSQYHVEGGNKLGSAIVFTLGKENSIKPNDKKRSIFNYTSEIYLIEITPIIFQVKDNKQRLISCGNAKIKEMITCGEGIIVPESCGNDTCDAGENCLNCPADCGVCCENGIIDTFAGEECDGTNLSGQDCESQGYDSGNLDCYPAGHAQECTFNETGCVEAGAIQERIIFVSSTNTLNGNLGGISGADATCNSLASAANLSGTFVAWLSNTTLNAKDRIPTGEENIPFNRTDGAKVADNLADLIDGPDPMIDLDESEGEQLKQFVWTGTNSTGHVVIGYNCNNWQSSASGDQGTRGKTDKDWTDEDVANCDVLSRIYCFQIS